VARIRASAKRRVFLRTMRAGIRIAMVAAIAVVAASSVRSQQLDPQQAITSECADAIRSAMAHVASGQLAEAGQELSSALTKAESGAARARAGLVLHNMATIAWMSGRFAEGERLALRSVASLERVYPPDHFALLRPLLILASTRVEQGKKSGARDAFNRLKRIPIERPDERAMIHGMTGSLLLSLGQRPDAEVEYRAALADWTEIGRGETAEAGAILTSLGILYMEERRPEDAWQALDRASAIFSHSPDAAPIDRIKLLHVRGTLHARQHEWADAEREFREALSLADRQLATDPVYVFHLLTSLAEALSKNHHRQEARAIKVRASALRPADASTAVMDISDLARHPKL
jgi:tetratricopeptide (TPR) repeat protein